MASLPAAAAARSVPGDPSALDRRGMAVLAIAHVIDDLNQSALPALLPFLIAAQGLTYTSASFLVLFASLASSLVQPAIGALADRRAMPWLVPLGVFLAGGGLALVGIAPSYGAIVVAVAISGIGIATFHPEAARYANYAAGAAKASGMRWFAVGGNLGFALGPLAVWPLVLVFGLKGTLGLAVPVTLAALVLLRELPRLDARVPHAAARRSAGIDRWGPFAGLTVAICVRSMAYIGLVTFIPLFLIGVSRVSKQEADVALTVFLLAGALGTLAGGRFADRVGRKAAFVFSTLLSAPLILGFAFVTGATHERLLVLAVLILAGFVLVASQTAFIVMAQEYLPNRLGVASGVTLGLAISVGGAGAPLLGALADRLGLYAALEAIAALVLLAGLIAAFLPRTAVDRAISERIVPST
ncbi:MAG: MFS transporter [Vulcanimicrobiaceae bacterium]